MNNSSFDADLNFGLRTLGFQPEIIDKWNKIIHEFTEKGIEIVEFEPITAKNNHWGLAIEPILDGKDSAKVRSKAKIRYLNKTANNELQKAFEPKNKIVSEHWDKLFSGWKLAGFYIPLQDIKRIDGLVLKSHLNFYQLLIKHFQYRQFFEELQEKLVDVDTEEDKIPHVIWYYLKYYIKFLRKLKSDSYSQYQLVGHWFSEQLDQDDFHQRLPSEQLTILFLNRCESMVSETVDQWHNQRIYSKASVQIEAFFKVFKDDFEAVFGGNETNLEEGDVGRAELEQLAQKMKREFISIFLDDRDIFLFQEILDNQSKIALSTILPLMDQLKYGSKSLYNVSGVIKDTVFNSKQRPAGHFKEHDKDMPVYSRPREFTYPKRVQYWYDIDASERKEILAVFKNMADVQTLQQGEQASIFRSEDYLLNLINLISAPIIYWERANYKIFPRWNLFSDEEAKNFREIYREKKVKKATELKILRKHLKALLSFTSIEEINSYVVKENPIFSHQKYHEKWVNELKKIKQRIAQKERFYQTRMKEFGILNSKMKKKDKVTYLEEMLTIEDEVKPYINFVKQAFQTALPIRKNVSFSPYRHSNDGVEFDADTLFDQEKWIRADVMRVMESQIERGDAIQINTFCLDFSGSMTHDRMRNLFKTLYLLVLGLEDRKSFDSFHFFSNAFIEAVNFDMGFTDRKVLFKILKQISMIDSIGVHYAGLGGTNISEGVDLCHKKMKKFIGEFKEKNPMANIVSSMFVITDGEPSLGITDIVELNEFIESKRLDGDVEIKGIFIRSEDDIDLELMEDIFGSEHFVETNDFEEGVNKFVKIMTETYKAQRKAFKWKQKKRKLGLTK